MLLRVYNKDGVRYASHHCDGKYEHVTDILAAAKTAVLDDEVSRVEIAKAA